MMRFNWKAPLVCSFLFACTGSAVDWSLRPEVWAAASKCPVFGIYSGMPNRGVRSEKVARMKELQSLGVNTLIHAGPLLPPTFNTEEFVRDLHAHGIELAAMVTRSEDWYGPAGKGDFDAAKAEEKLRLASPFAAFYDYLYLAHEVSEFATHEERVRMYRLAKHYLPNTPVLMYYGGSIDRMDETPTHRRRGNILKEYQFGPGEADIALISVGKGSRGKIDIEASQQRLQNTWRIIKASSPATRVWVSTSFAPDDMMQRDRGSMWSPAQIEQFGSTLMSSGKLDGFFLRAYGRFTYDLGHPDWQQQRKAFASLSPGMKAGRVDPC